MSSLKQREDGITGITPISCAVFLALFIAIHGTSTAQEKGYAVFFTNQLSHISEKHGIRSKKKGKEFLYIIYKIGDKIRFYIKSKYSF